MVDLLANPAFRPSTKADTQVSNLTADILTPTQSSVEELMARPTRMNRKMRVEIVRSPMARRGLSLLASFRKAQNALETMTGRVMRVKTPMMTMMSTCSMMMMKDRNSHKQCHASLPQLSQLYRRKLTSLNKRKTSLLKRPNKKRP